MVDRAYSKRCIVTGAAGFVGSALVRMLVEKTGATVLAIDKLTYAGRPESLKEAGLSAESLVSSNPRLEFLRADICDLRAMADAFSGFRPDAVFHLAAETHVDRSIDDPLAFVRTNVEGTSALLVAALEYWRSLDSYRRSSFRFQHISTDEVYGALGETGRFSERSPYAPRSPYSASKAGADHLVRAWHSTYGLPVLITHCTNNFGPYQFPEKLVPLAIARAVAGKPIPVYGDGSNVRDWIHVDDHAEALVAVGRKGIPGETYDIGGRREISNREIVEKVCALLDEFRPRPGGGSYVSQISFVADRPGHDFRYAIDPSKIENDLGWRPRRSFDESFRETVRWYLDNEWWWRAC